MFRLAFTKRAVTEKSPRRASEAPRELTGAELHAVAGGKMKRLLGNNRHENEARRNGGWTGTGAGGSW